MREDFKKALHRSTCEFQGSVILICCYWNEDFHLRTILKSEEEALRNARHLKQTNLLLQDVTQAVDFVGNPWQSKLHF